MRPDSETITLGGEQFAIRPLTLRQVRQIIPLSKKLQTLNDTVEQIDGIVELLGIILVRDYPSSAAPDHLLDLGITRAEIASAVAAIQRLSGTVLSPGSAGEGEAPAAPTASTTGGPSTAA